jgi:tRNA pseudouridine38-40 synthase
LPTEIAIYDILKVAEVAHARFDATERTYKYFIHLNKDPFLDDRSWFIGNYKPNIEKMNTAANALLGFKDFSSFEKKGSDNTNSLCTLFAAKWEYTEQNSIMVFTITANRFLRNMVRRIVACLLEIGLERMDQQIMINAMENKAYFEVGLTAPANGLYLWEIKYPYIVNS